MQPTESATADAESEAIAKVWDRLKIVLSVGVLAAAALVAATFLGLDLGVSKSSQVRAAVKERVPDDERLSRWVIEWDRGDTLLHFKGSVVGSGAVATRRLYEFSGGFSLKGSDIHQMYGLNVRRVR